MSFLGLEKERVAAVATQHQHDEGAGADAADANHLERRVDEAVAVEQNAAVLGKRVAVVGDDLQCGLFEALALLDQLVDRHDQRRFADDAQLAVNLAGQLRERPHPVLGTGLREVAAEAGGFLLAGGRFPTSCDRLHVDLRVPDLEVAELGHPPHRRPVLGRHRGNDVQPLAALEAALAPGDGEARGEPHHVPLPRPRQSLVEVVDVEDELAIGRGVGAEVGEVGVAAELHVEAAARGRRQVGRHHRRRAAVEGEGRDQHARIAQRHELANPRGGLGLEQLDRVRAVCRRLPLIVARARRLAAGGLAGGGSLLRAAMAVFGVEHAQTVAGSGSSRGGSGPARIWSKRWSGRRRVVQKDARVRKAAKRKAVFSAFSCASS